MGRSQVPSVGIMGFSELTWTRWKVGGGLGGGSQLCFSTDNRHVS
jgi:hypothetical protein